MDIAIKVICVIAAYLVGSINAATIVSKIKGKNIKKLGSGNPGTMNVLRSIGKGWGALTFAFDSVKGLAFALIGRFAIDGGSTDWLFILGTIVVIGHIFPIYTGFKGGKGVATSIGVFLVASPIVATCVLVGLVIYLLVCKIGFIGSYLAITALTLTCCITYGESVVVVVCCIIMWLLVVIRHKDNVIRFIHGKENTLSIVGKNKVKQLDDDGNEISDDEEGIPGEKVDDSQKADCACDNSVQSEPQAQSEDDNADGKASLKCDKDN